MTLDIDSVLTDLSQVQAATWALALDGFLTGRQQDSRLGAFDPHTDLHRLVDGVRTPWAVSALLQERGVDFPDARTAQRTGRELARRQQTVLDR
ncbi:hypothetical protein [Streptomyces orinoci]|uniref:Uncharacterized protein n=1 Tax=Streptomyces orinoci TaxID=67339 RepID=A0ABV3K0U9_STRON|nr:hypothetical protein [Streptomyces orinoci]